MAISVHRLDYEHFDRRTGRWLLSGALLVIDSDSQPCVGDLVRMLDGQLREVTNPQDDDAIGNGARVISTMVPR